MTDNKEWIEVCQAYADSVNAKLVFVNDYDFGIWTEDDRPLHIYADELVQILEARDEA